LLLLGAIMGLRESLLRLRDRLKQANQKHRALTYTQQRWLKALTEGRDPGEHLHGASAHGGANGTVYSLIRRGYIDNKGNITDAGREVLKQSV
jgi:hypothetical protein